MGALDGKCSICQSAPATHTVRKTRTGGYVVQHAYSVGSRHYCVTCAWQRATHLEETA